MSGHNRWSKLKRAKAISAVSKGRVWTKLINELTMAARLGGGDLANNARLRTALGLAREANMPNDTITRAIKKGTGELPGARLEEVLYEGYGPGGVALLVECVTDNLNRTAADVRSTFLTYGNSLASPGAVKFIFSKKGSIPVKAGPSEEAVLEQAILAGAEDMVPQGAEGFEVRTAPAQLHGVAAALEKAGLALGPPRYTWVPSTTVKVEGDLAPKLVKLLEKLDEHDDVQNVFANFEMDDALLEDLSG
jgi:YebC/PmpR family DNA-binding regulatory protein